ncbi:MAG: hypothetical protein DIJKHBIC_02059 [Thermoanaerobaculia bacterium]|nr:hypothetical protein [Thermoanaerobaculia bacterium]
MYTNIAEFESDFAELNKATLKVLKELTDTSLGQTVSPGGRTLGRIAWHIVGTLVEMPGHAGMKIDGSLVERPVPQTAAEIVAGYEEAARLCREAVKTGWAEADLSEKITVYGESWSRSRVLFILQLHEVHHRGQLTVLMRQAGLRVPGVAGPAREEWASYGMPEQP